MAKKIQGYIRLQLPAGAANPAPPVGPALGAQGVNIMAFCKDFNARTKDQNGMILPVVITVFSEDAMLSWLAFLKIMCLFLLQKDVLEYRLEFLLRFLKLTRPEDLERADYMQDKLQKFQFAKRGIVVSDVPTLLFWNRVRAALSKQNAYIFEQTGPARGTAAVLNMSRAIGVLIDSGIEASDTVCFFDSLFDIS